MSEWNHPICDPCWERREGDRVPHRIIEPEAEICCVCGGATRSGIYQRVEPGMLAHHVDGRHAD